MEKWIIIWLLVLNVILILITIITNIRVKNFQLKNINFMKKLGNGNNLEEMIKEYINITNYVNQKSCMIEAEVKKIEKNMMNCIQKIGVVRYNAFNDVGSNLSFAIALLDADNNGIVLNGVYARDTSSIYAKSIILGESQYELSNEEKQAIKKAKENKKN
ncbi:MAG: DUF4446 family protein [Clostridia bacterium]|nr:DUF4446 family protein [Clostridia bacterium]